MNECHFEPVPLDCVECGGLTDQIGTCADIVYCPRCRELTRGDDSPEEEAEIFITFAERTPYIGTTEEN